MRRRAVLLLLVGWAWARVAWGENPAALLEAGNARYEKGDFAGARDRYEQAVTAGGGAGALYNLGNACFRLGKLGEAILYWQRAQRLAPRDADIRANLDHARELCADDIRESPRPFWVRVALAAHRAVTANEAFVAGVIAYWAACACLLALLRGAGDRWRRHLVRAALALGVVAALASLSSAAKVHESAARETAIVTAPEAEARSAPGEGFPRKFTVHEGTEVRIAGRRGVWYEVRLANGVEGWLPMEAITPL